MNRRKSERRRIASALEALESVVDTNGRDAFCDHDEVREMARRIGVPYLAIEIATGAGEVTIADIEDLANSDAAMWALRRRPQA